VPLAVDESLRRYHLPSELRDDFHGDLVLQSEDVLQVAIVAISPNVFAGQSVDQLGRNAHPVAVSPHTAFEHVLNPQFFAHLLDLDRLAFVSERGVAGDHEEIRYLREGGDDLLRDAVTKELLFGSSLM